MLRFSVSFTLAVSVWAFTVNREIIHWVDSPLKSLAMCGFGLIVAVATALPLLFWPRGPWTRLALAGLVCVGLGEFRQTWLRESYAATRSSDESTDWLRPISTTDLAVRRYTVPLFGLRIPRLRVVHVTDLHVTRALPATYYAALHGAIREQDPDLVVFTGDSLSRPERLMLLESWLLELPRPRLGSFGVLGNHEYWAGQASEVVRAFETAGVTMLGGRCTDVLLPNGGAIRICGTESPWGPGLDAETIRRREFGAPDASVPVLVLSHTPDNIYDLAERGASAVFAGHTHGGQIRFPLLGSLIIPSVYGRRFDLGHFHVEGSDLFVSAGVGADSPPFRVWCRPELVVVDFTAE